MSHSGESNPSSPSTNDQVNNAQYLSPDPLGSVRPYSRDSGWRGPSSKGEKDARVPLSQPNPDGGGTTAPPLHKSTPRHALDLLLQEAKDTAASSFPAIFQEAGAAVVRPPWESSVFAHAGETHGNNLDEDFGFLELLVKDVLGGGGSVAVPSKVKDGHDTAVGPLSELSMPGQLQRQQQQWQQQQPDLKECLILDSNKMSVPRPPSPLLISSGIQGLRSSPAALILAEVEKTIKDECWAEVGRGGKTAAIATVVPPATIMSMPGSLPGKRHGSPPLALMVPPRDFKKPCTAVATGRKGAMSASRKCKGENCTRHPHFGFQRAEYCSFHKLKGMINVKGRRCKGADCPVFGCVGDSRPTFCASHKEEGMLDIKNPCCKEGGCRRQPSFGFETDWRATYCAIHKRDGMVNVRRRSRFRRRGEEYRRGEQYRRGGEECSPVMMM